MKTLVNKVNPAIRITAPEIEEYLNNYFISCNDTAGRSLILQKSDWTLVEEEPKHTEVWVEGRTIFEQDANTFVNTEEEPKKVYRVENEKEQQGLWRKFDGTWAPLFDILTDGQCKDMPMEDNPIYREGGKQWFASAPSKETLQKWFSKRDLEELTAKGFTISEFEVIGYKKINDLEYIFTRDNIISRTYLKVSDIYPQEQDELTWKDIKQIIQIADSMLTNTAWDAVDYPDEQKYYEQVLKQYKKQKNK